MVVVVVESIPNHIKILQSDLTLNLMKIKILTLIAVTAIITLSFTFISSKNDKKKSAEKSTRVQNDNEPIGGFGQDDKN